MARTLTDAGNTQNTIYDALVIGGGLAGLTLTARLAKAGLSVCCIDRDDPQTALKPGYDDRTIAISFGAQKVIAAAGAWHEDALAPCPIEDIQILDGASPVLLNMNSEEMRNETNASAFGWIFEISKLRASLMSAVKEASGATHIAPARVSDFSISENTASALLADGRQLQARIIIGADGRGSFTREWMKIPVRQWSYDQTALVFPVFHEKPHGNTAIEHFREEGPFAILPMRDDANGRHRSAVVWTVHGKKSAPQEWPENVFNEALTARFPDFYGRVERAAAPVSYPLGLIHAARYTGPRMVLIGDAAHGIHPIAGQGLNLGLRDIDVLTTMLSDTQKSGNDIGAPALLEEYERQRKTDTVFMAGFTDNLNRLFSLAIPGLPFLRKAGLKAMKHFPQGKKRLMRYAMGLSQK